nr:DegT/DnrJ/EryC1/StrS family aminotransferase [Bdellovibrio sp. HAGR004]
MIPVTKTFLPEIDVYVRYLQDIWHSGQLTNNGAMTKELEERLLKKLGVPHLQLVGNGTLALQVAIKALSLEGEVITTPYSYVATTNSILWEGLTPIFVDINPNSFCIDPNLIEEAITEKTSAILATHVYGYPCDVERIQQIAEKYNLKVIYDAAHAFGVRLNGNSILNYGDCSTLSFHATKLFHTGEGGAIVSQNPDIAERLFLMSKFGHIGEDNYIDLGINAKISELHASMGLSVLPHVDAIIASRRACSEWYDECLEGLNIQRPKASEGLEYNYAYYPVVFESNDAMMAVRAALQSKDIFARRYFYPSLNTLNFLLNGKSKSCPVSEGIAMRVLSLPLFVGLTYECVVEISEILRRVLKK